MRDPAIILNERAGASGQALLLRSRAGKPSQCATKRMHRSRWGRFADRLAREQLGIDKPQRARPANGAGKLLVLVCAVRSSKHPVGHLAAAKCDLQSLCLLFQPYPAQFANASGGCTACPSHVSKSRAAANPAIRERPCACLDKLLTVGNEAAAIFGEHIHPFARPFLASRSCIWN